MSSISTRRATGTRFDAVLSILDEKGQEVASQDDYYFDKDPHLEHRFAQPGEYVVRVNGFREAGSPFSEYRLLMGELPSLSYVFPAGAQRGKSVELMVVGSNLDKVDGFSWTMRQCRRNYEREYAAVESATERSGKSRPRFLPVECSSRWCGNTQPSHFRHFR